MFTALTLIGGVHGAAGRLVPAVVTQVAGDVVRIGSALDDANPAAATRTIAVAAPGMDEISVAAAKMLGSHAQQYQIVSAQATEFHSQFADLLASSAGAYVATEAANVQRTLAAAASGSG